MSYKDGDTITVNGKACRIEGGALVPVVRRGPLGGELKQLGDCKPAEIVYMSNSALFFAGLMGEDCLVEVNIPPRPAFTPMTAGDAAKLPDIVGRWVAVRVCNKSSDELVLGDEKYERWFDSDDKIMLIEGVGL